MMSYFVENGADVNYKNDGGFFAVIYTRSLGEHEKDFVDAQLRLLERTGANMEFDEKEK